MYLNVFNICFLFSILWLTLTWDVFKLIHILKEQLKNMGLTLTWDVFK